MKGGKAIQTASNPAAGKEEIIFKNKIKLNYFQK
jgi:hypothetical protein